MAHPTNTPDMPPVTDAHRKAAFCAMRWPGWTYEAAMLVDMRRRLIECRAHALRTSEWVATQQRTVVPVRRCRPGTDGHPLKWATQLVMGPFVPTVQADFDKPTNDSAL